MRRQALPWTARAALGSAFLASHMAGAGRGGLGRLLGAPAHALTSSSGLHKHGQVRAPARAVRRDHVRVGYFRPSATIFRRMNAICVCSGSSFGHTSWQPSSDMQPNTPSSSPMTS